MVGVFLFSLGMVVFCLVVFFFLFWGCLFGVFGLCVICILIQQQLIELHSFTDAKTLGSVGQHGGEKEWRKLVREER